MVRSLYTRRIQSGRTTDTKARFCSSKRGKRIWGNAKRVSIYYLVRRARIRAHLRVALVPGVVHPDGSTARDRVVLVFLLLLLSAAAAAFFSRGRRHDESGASTITKECVGFVSRSSFPKSVKKTKDTRDGTQKTLPSLFFFILDKP